MYQFDNRFLDSVGLSELNDGQKEAFLDYAQEQFEVRIGEAMSSRLNEDQLAEFDKISEGDAEIIADWLSKHEGYEKDADYRRILKAVGDEQESKVSYVTKKWLDDNCPDYDELIQNTLANFQKEIYDQRESILA